MARPIDGKPEIECGLNSWVEYLGQRYQVQTQCSMRDAPVIESLVFDGGQMLVRITASYDDVARNLGFTPDDGRHLIELQHSNLIRKIRHGMLRDDEGAARPRPRGETPQIVDADGTVVDPAQIDDPSVLDLLHELGVAIDEVRPAAPEPERRASPSPSRPWWRRLTTWLLQSTANRRPR